MTQPDADVDLLVGWNVAFRIEGLNGSDSPGLREAVRQELELWIAEDRGFVLEVGGAPVAQAGFNAVIPDMVQVGFVFTPPQLRGRGYAAQAVAGALQIARARGAVRATLFTQNPQAERAYARLGFEPVEDYWMALFNEGAKYEATDAAEAINCDFYCHGSALRSCRLVDYSR